MYQNLSNVKVYENGAEAHFNIGQLSVVSKYTTPGGRVFAEFANDRIAINAGGDWAFPEQIKELNLTSKGLTEFPESIRKMVKLQTLMLGGNQIKKIPDWICELQNLKRLYLHNNSIEKIPQSIEKLKNLQFVNLDWNPITTITPQINTLVSKDIVHLNKEISVSSDIPQIPTAKDAKTRTEKIRKSMTEKYWEATLKTFIAERIEDAISNGESHVNISNPTYFNFVKEKLCPLGYEIFKIEDEVVIRW